MLDKKCSQSKTNERSNICYVFEPSGELVGLGYAYDSKFFTFAGKVRKLANHTKMNIPTSEMFLSHPPCLMAGIYFDNEKYHKTKKVCYKIHTGDIDLDAPHFMTERLEQVYLDATE